MLKKVNCSGSDIQAVQVTERDNAPHFLAALSANASHIDTDFFPNKL